MISMNYIYIVILMYDLISVYQLLYLDYILMIISLLNY